MVTFSYDPSLSIQQCFVESKNDKITQFISLAFFASPFDLAPGSKLEPQLIPHQFRISQPVAEAALNHTDGSVSIRESISKFSACRGPKSAIPYKELVSKMLPGITVSLKKPKFIICELPKFGGRNSLADAKMLINCGWS